MKKTSGFTVIELIIVIVFLGFTAGLLIYQKANVEAAQRDSQRKTAINAMYYSLEEVFYEKNGYYPKKIDSKILRSIDPKLFTDPEGIKLGETGSDYRYDSIGCTDNRCKSYTLNSRMEKEADYIKSSRNN